MNGAAVTITVMTLAAANTLGIPVDIPTAIILSVLSALSACGASGVAGGSLLLIPLACSLFGISSDVAMQVIGVGFIIGVVQDSVETALNSSCDFCFPQRHSLGVEKRRTGDYLLKLYYMHIEINFSICYNANRQTNDSTHRVHKKPPVCADTGGSPFLKKEA